MRCSHESSEPSLALLDVSLEEVTAVHVPSRKNQAPFEVSSWEVWRSPKRTWVEVRQRRRTRSSPPSSPQSS